MNHVTGPTGSVGRALVRGLSKRGAALPCTFLRPTGSVPNVVGAPVDRRPPERAPA